MVDKKLTENQSVSFLRGAGGGGKKSGKVKDDANTLRSNAIARVLALLCEGEIKGLVDGAKSIYLDDVPLHNEHGNPNFSGVNWAFRHGLPDQEPITAMVGVENEMPVGVEVTSKMAITRTLLDADYTSCRVTVRIPALVNQTDNGMKRTSVKFQIIVRYHQGPWETPFGSGGIEIWGKTTSAYDKQFSFALPKAPNGQNSHPWEIQVIRLMPDSHDIKLQNSIYFGSLTGIIDEQFTYPDSALFGMTVDAEQFERGMPNLSLLLDGKIIKVPSNYDPETRAYTGIWDGTFKEAYCDNPAWIYYDLLENNRSGLGGLLESVFIDKWTLYDIGRNCDVMVPNGYGGEEPRFTIGAYITRAEEAYDLLQKVASAFRGMSFWSSGAVTATQDVPSDPVVLATRANVIKGEFSYSGSALAARHTVAHVKFYDPNDMYRPSVEVVRDHDGIIRYGERVKEVDAFGCTSRGQAHRVGQWILMSEMNETQTVSYTAGFDHGHVKVGDIVLVMDEKQANVDHGGRIIKQIDNRWVKLDRPITAGTSSGAKLLLTHPDGEVVEYDLASDFTDATEVMVASDIPVDLLPASVWILSKSTVKPKPYRVLSIKANEEHQFDIVALEHYSPKYAIIEGDPQFAEPIYRQEAEVETVENLNAVEYQFFKDGVPRSNMTISWSVPVHMYAAMFRVEIDGPGGDTHIVYPSLAGSTVDVEDIIPGTWSIRVYSLSLSGARFQPATLDYNAMGWEGVDLPEVQNLRLASPFTTADCSIVWENDFPNAPTNNPMFKRAEVKIYSYINSLKTLRRSEYVFGNSYTYSFALNEQDGIPARELIFEVSATDIYDRTGEPAELTAYNEPIPAPTVEVTAGMGSIVVSYAIPSVEDYVKTKVWISGIQDFDPTLTVPAYVGISSFHAHPVDDHNPRYIRVAHIDSFSDNDFAVSSELSTSALPLMLDTTPPATPTGLSVVSQPYTPTQSKITITWDENIEPDFAYYGLEISENSNNWIPFTVFNNQYVFYGKPVTYCGIRLRAHDRAGNASTYTETWHQAAAWNSPPPTPFIDDITSGFGTVWLRWSSLDEYYGIAHYQIWEDVDGNISTYTVNNTSFMRSGLPDNQLCTFKVRATDISGNQSEWSEEVSVTTTGSPGVTQDDLQGLITNASFAEGLVGIEVLASLPSTGNKEGRVVLNTTDGKLYRFINGEWTVSTQAEDINGKLTAGQIAAGAIGADQIAANAISAKHLTIGDFTNLIDNGWATGDISGWDKHDSIFELPNPAINADHYGYTITSTGRVAATSKNIPVQSGEVYYIGVWVNNTDPNYDAWIGVGATKPDGTIVWSDLFSTNVKNDWVYLSGQYSVPDETESIFVYLFTARPFGETGSPAHWSKPLMRRAANDVLIADGAIKAEHLSTGELIANSAQIKDAIITDAKIVDLDAGKIKADTVLAGSIKVGNDTLDLIKNNASNPVTAINNGATLIDPGKILISGGTSLADWRMGGDTTKINGGNIATNTITANKLTIGSRGITVTGITFEHNKPDLNHVSWTSGSIRYIADNGGSSNRVIAADEAIWSYDPLYIYWQKNSINLQTTTNFNTANQPDNIILAVYKGGTNLDANYGRTIIEGNQIKTGSITANQIQAGAIQAQQIAADAISAGHIQSNAIVANKIAANAITTDKIVSGAITADKIAAGAITADLLTAGSIHGSVIQAGTLNADRIAAGTITADKIMAETVEATNLKPAAITQVAFGSGTNFSLGLDIQHGHVLIIAQTSGIPSGYNAQMIKRNGVNLVAYSTVTLNYTTIVHKSGQGGGDYYTQNNTVHFNQLLYSDSPPPGWHSYTFPSGSAIIMNYKR